MNRRLLLFIPSVLTLISCSFLNIGMDSGFDSGGEIGEPIASQGSSSIVLDDPARYPAFAGIPLDAESATATGRFVIPAFDVAPGVVRGVLPDGTPYIGSSDAPIIVAEYADFSCPHCANYAPEAERVVAELVRTGQARYTFNILTFVGGESSRQAGEAALCAGEQGAFWEYRSELFGIQSQEGRNGFVVERLIEKAAELGLNADSFRTCLNSDNQLQVLDEMQQRASIIGISSVPTVVYSINNGDDWQYFIGADGSRTPRSSFEDIKAIVESLQP